METILLGIGIGVAYVVIGGICIALTEKIDRDAADRLLGNGPIEYRDDSDDA